MSDSFAGDKEQTGEAQPTGGAPAPAARVGAIGTTFEPLTAEELIGSRAPATGKAAGATAAAQAADKTSQTPPAEATRDATETAVAGEAVAVPSAAGTPIETTPVVLAAGSVMQAPSEPAESRTRGTGCLRDALLIGLGSLLGAMLALGLLFYVNGTIDFGQHERVKLLDSSIDTLQRQNDDLQSQLQQHTAALDEVKADIAADAQKIAALKAQADGAQEAVGAAALVTAQELDERLAQTEAKTAAQAAAIDEVAKGNSEIRSQLDEANKQIADLQQGAARLELAVQDLQKLLSGGLSGTPASGRTIASTPALTAFPPAAPIPAPRPGQGHLFGVVWADSNGNGLPDAGEEAVSGVRVVLRSSASAELASTVTGADGRYLFADLDPNPYEVVAFIPRTLAPARPHTVSVSVGSDGEVEVNMDSLAP